MRRFRKGWELNMALETAYTEFWIGIGRLCEPFQLEMHSMTVGAFNIHGTQRMPKWRFMIWTTTFWNIPQGLIVNHNLLNMFCFHLLIHLLLLIKIKLMLLFLYLPLLVLLLLQFRKMSLMFHLPLLFLLPLQFSQVCLMLQDFLIIIDLPLCIISQ